MCIGGVTGGCAGRTEGPGVCVCVCREGGGILHEDSITRGSGVQSMHIWPGSKGGQTNLMYLLEWVQPCGACLSRSTEKGSKAYECYLLDP